MKFTVGGIAENPEFQPEVDGWSPLREPSSKMYMVLAVPVAFVLANVLAIAWALIVELRGIPLSGGDSLAPVLAAAIVLIPVHEGVHALCHPGFGSSPYTLFGVWPSHLAFWAHYDNQMSRSRFLLTLSAPFLLLTVVPLAIAIALGFSSWFLISLSWLNAIGASADLLGFAIVLFQLKRDVVVRNQVWKTWWRASPTKVSS